MYGKKEGEADSPGAISDLEPPHTCRWFEFACGVTHMMMNSLGRPFPSQPELDIFPQGQIFLQLILSLKVSLLEGPGICPGLVPHSCILRIQILVPCHHHRQPQKQASKASFSEHPRMAAVLLPLFSFQLPLPLCSLRNIFENFVVFTMFTLTYGTFRRVCSRRFYHSICHISAILPEKPAIILDMNTIRISVGLTSW